jgi:hypothetical protein
VIGITEKRPLKMLELDREMWTSTAITRKLEIE